MLAKIRFRSFGVQIF